MKPKDLKRAFSFAERRPLLQDHIFYVPIYYQEHDKFHLPSFYEYFKNDHPVFIEYCSGNGDWIVNKAKENPKLNWIAVEKRFDRVRKIWSKLQNDSLSNILIIYGEAYTFTHHYLFQESVEGIYINFPDPWPKLKHAKNRLIQTPFLNEIARILKVDKQATLVTDDHCYLSAIVTCFCAHPRFTPLLPIPYYHNKLQDYGTSWFENFWRELGKEIYFTHFKKC